MIAYSLEGEQLPLLLFLGVGTLRTSSLRDYPVLLKSSALTSKFLYAILGRRKNVWLSSSVG